MRKTHFFHNGVKVDEFRAPLPGETPLFMNLHDAVEFYTTREFQASEEGRLLLADGSRRFQRLFDMTVGDMDDIAGFLEAISQP